jgi:hypothetical protein
MPVEKSIQYGKKIPSGSMLLTVGMIDNKEAKERTRHALYKLTFSPKITETTKYICTITAMNQLDQSGVNAAPKCHPSEKKTLIRVITSSQSVTE